MTRGVSSHIKRAALALVAGTLACTEMNSQDARLLVTDDGKYVLEGRTYALSELGEALRALKAQRPNVNLHVSASSSAQYEQVAPAMKLAQEQASPEV